MDIEKIENFTKEILIQKDMFGKLPVDILAIANSEGIEVYNAELENKISGLLRKRDGKFEILLKDTDVIARKRFTLAHELAHYFLHKNKFSNDGEVHIDELYRENNKNGINQDEEKEADFFAGSLLMNKELTEKIYQSGIINVSELARIFGVSESAMTVRMMVLHIL